MSEKRSDLDAARDMVGLIGKQALSVMREADAFRNEALALRAEVARLREALEKYGRHSDRCALVYARLTGNVPAPCTCGLTAALQETRHE